MRFFDLNTIQERKEGEEYIKLIRRSKLGYIFNTFSFVFLIFLWGTILYFGWVWIIYWDLKFHLIEFIFLIAYFLIILFLWFYFRYATYLLITSHRIEKHWVNYYLWDEKEVLWYHEITKVSYAYPSFLAKIFGYWRVEIMAGDTEKSNIIFDLAPNPDRLASELRQIKVEYHKKWYDL